MLTLGPGSGFRPQQGWGRGGAGASSAAQDSVKTDKDKRPSRCVIQGDNAKTMQLRGRERKGERERERGREREREGERERERERTNTDSIYI